MWKGVRQNEWFGRPSVRHPRPQSRHQSGCAMAKEAAEKALVMSQLFTEKLDHFLEDYDLRLKKVEEQVGLLGIARHKIDWHRPK